jgi:transposase InsO family protein
MPGKEDLISLRAKKNQEVTLNIRRVHKNSGEKYGSPRIFKQLCAEGFKIGRNRIARIMRKNGIQILSPT